MANETIQTLEKQFRDYVKKIEDYNQALSVLAWDSRTGAPKKGVAQRSEVIGTLSSEVFQMSTSKHMRDFLNALQEKDVYEHLSRITQRTVDECQKRYDRNAKIPKEEYKEYVMLESQAESVWEEAKERSDFEMFRPYLEKILSFKKRFISYWGYDTHPYNTLLDDYEPGIFVETIDDVFSELRDGLIPLVKGVAESTHKPKTDFIYRTIPYEQQKRISVDILHEIGYDFSKGRLDETVHPFAIGINPNDVRVTTKYVENDFKVALFGTIHEGGHALYEQNIAEDLIGTPLCDGTSMGIHESQSLFWEKFIGKNERFWERNYDRIKQSVNGQFDDISLQEFYFAINEVKPSLIRIESDELTYCLHIILRYELEKALIKGDLPVKELPAVWNEKMNEYLGVIPKNDEEGVLQDVHWSCGAFGYFPSYALGYIYAAQLNDVIMKDIPHFEQCISTGQYHDIHDWLKEKVHRHGAMKKPSELMKDITGGGIDAKPLLHYLTNKYRRLYQF